MALRASLWVVALAVSGCAAGSLRYSTGSIPKLSAGSAHVVVTDPIDARNSGSAPTFGGRIPREEMTELTLSVREHAAASTFATSLVSAPTSREDVDALLTKAASEGATEVVFLRYLGANGKNRLVSLAAVAYIGILPWLIVDSLPLSRHGGTGYFEAIVVDPKSHDVLADVLHIASFGEHCSAWGHAPVTVIQDMIRKSVHRVMADVVAQRAAGFPNKRTFKDVEALVLSAPFVRVEPDRVWAPGWSVARPAGWKVLDEPKVLLKMVSPKQEIFVVGAEPTWGDSDEYSEAAVKNVKVTSDKPARLDGRAAHEITESPKDGVTLTQRIVSLGGYGLVFTCNNGNGDGTTCGQLFDSVKLEGEAKSRDLDLP